MKKRRVMSTAKEATSKGWASHMRLHWLTKTYGISKLLHATARFGSVLPLTKRMA